MTWNEITNQTDIDELMAVFGEFHDGCIREMHLWTESCVERNLSMSCSDHLDHHVRLLVQRQYSDPSAIELLFDEVKYAAINPSAENYLSIIFGATLILQEGIFYWADVGNWLPDQENSMGATWISACKLRWRDASKWMGEELRYGPKDMLASDKEL